MKQMMLLFLILNVPNVAADELLYRNGTLSQGRFVLTHGNVVYFASGGDTLAISGYKIKRIRLDDGGEAVFDAARDRFSWKNVSAVRKNRHDKTRALAVAVGVVTAAMAYDNYQGAREADAINNKMAEMGADETLLSPRRRFLFVFYGAASVLSFILAAK